MELPMDIATEVGAMLKVRKESIAVAESSAGGLIAANLLAVPGASRYFVAGSVVYTQNARDLLMAITDAEMADKRSSSEPYAALLAQKLLDRHNTTWALAETGAAGPTGNSYGDPAGLSCIAVAGPDQFVHTITTGSDDRAQNMQTFARAALETLANVVNG